MKMNIGEYIMLLWQCCVRLCGGGYDPSCWGCVPFPDGRDSSAEVASLRRCGVAPERIYVGGDFRHVLSCCRENDTLLVFLPAEAAGHRDLLCELLLEASRRKVNFRAVGAYRFEICHDEHLLCGYLLLHTLLEELYVQAAQKGVSGAPKCRLKC